MDSTNSMRSLRSPVAWTFFKPVQFHRQLPDLLLQSFHLTFRLERLRRRSILEDLRQAFLHLTFPLADLRRVDLILAGDLRHGLDPA